MTPHLLAPVVALLLAQAPDPSSSPALTAVRTWMSALAEKDPEKLRAASLLPFTLVTDRKGKKCDATVKDDKTFKNTANCMLSKEKGLVDGLQQMDDVVLQGAEPKGTPPVAKQLSSVRKLVGRLGKAEGQTTVEGYLNGDGLTFEFIFAVRPRERMSLSRALLCIPRLSNRYDERFGTA